MKQLIRKLLAGDSAITEYAHITVAGVIHEKVYLEINHSFIDVTEKQWILCIEPVVYGIWIENDKRIIINKENDTKLYFCDSARSNVKKEALGVVTMVFLERIQEDKGALYLFTEKKSKVYQLNSIKRFLLFSRYYKKNGLSFSKFKSFVSAYTYPRRVRIISFRQGEYYNIFPMDLLGDISTHNRYVFGLRHSNISLKKIIETGKLVVSEVSFKYKDAIFKLGRHHSSKPPSLDTLRFNFVHSRYYAFEIPDIVNSYKEISILKTINMGSHMLLWGEVVSETSLIKPDGHLFLIHFLQLIHQKNRGYIYPLI